MPKIHSWLTNEDSKLWAMTSRIGSVFGVVTPLVTVPVLIIAGNTSVPATILAIYVCVLSSVLIVLFIRQENRYLREMRYAGALLPMRKAFGEVANASWNLFHDDPSQDAFRLRLGESLRRFAEAFTLITGSQCRACIKLIQAPENPANGHDMLVSTLCRDHEGSDPPRHAPDRIADNTDFKQIFTEDMACFFCNDLPAKLSQGYKNSHWDEHAIEIGKFDYRATIVWPIERGTRTGTHDVPREIIGFLCIDTLKTNSFHPTYDEALGAAFAQALYLVLHRFREVSGSVVRSTQSAEKEPV
jgi:hypothetical protein